MATITDSNPSWESYNFGEMDNVLIIGSSGGGGHNAAADAMEKQLKATNQDAKIVRQDLLKDIVGNRLSNNGVGKWDEAQKAGDIKKLEGLFEKRWLGEHAFATPVFFKVIKLLWKNNVDAIIDTQAIGTKHIVNAARIVNLFRHIFGSKNKQIRILKVMTDLPNDAPHFFDTIKKLNSNQKNIFTLYSSVSIDKQVKEWKDKQQKGFKWELGAAPLRPAFITTTKDTPATQEVPIRFRYTDGTPEEYNMINECIMKGKRANQQLRPVLLEGDRKEVIIEHKIPVKEDDVVNMVMLGSQAAENATKGYVWKHIELAKQDPTRNFVLFVFCGKHENGKQSLMKKVHNIVTSISETDYPQNLTVIPLGFQNDTEIAPMMRRCNNVFSRSGGLTAMEELNTVNADESQVFIHTESENVENYRKGIVCWEAGNAENLVDNIGAKIINPQSLTLDMLKKPKRRLLENIVLNTKKDKNPKSDPSIPKGKSPSFQYVDITHNILQTNVRKLRRQMHAHRRPITIAGCA